MKEFEDIMIKNTGSVNKPQLSLQLSVSLAP